MKDVMIDLETLGNSNNAVVVQIGACYFDSGTGEVGDTFQVNVDAESSLRAGFEVSGSTIYWWLGQGTDAQTSILRGEKEDVATAFNNLNLFLKKARCIWSHATFDFVILMNHLNRLNIKPKFHYRSARDIRTLVDLAKIDHKGYERAGIHHNALDDCIYQVRYTVDCIKAITR